ncbi:hypothetical protein QMK17_12435 [Rhodococcus sp. G-MC3]|uniref:protealysin inhibitor emfourin n=1 Tax=Rhodococcus sp. G-MC3 TaxID=3046209 RepID=UPI0024BB3B01|nr:protealysin inhibitor emfourin [Rhodococcus sp. G-MC3]MDJ0394136.1 hypothetical protein [Rhodococcus sp. G-MC3]
MHIEVVRTGGVAGMTRRARVDTDAIADESLVQEWRQLAEQAREMLVNHVETPTPGTQRDVFEWTVSVDDATCRMADSAVTGPLRTLAQRTLREGLEP